MNGAVGRMRQDVAIEPDSALAGERAHAHQALVAALLTNASQVVVEQVALVRREELAQVAADAVLRLIAERLSGCGVDRHDDAVQVVRADQSQAVLDQLAVAPFALEQGVMDVPPGGRQSFERGGISRLGGGVGG